VERASEVANGGIDGVLGTGRRRSHLFCPERILRPALGYQPGAAEQGDTIAPKWETGCVALDLDPGIAALGDPRLIQAIINEMDGGAISFERFMELALYHSEFGYYRKAGRIGRHGDFLTSPTVHPMFGWAVAAWCHEVWRRLG